MMVAQFVKNLPANAGDAADAGSVLGLGRSLGEENVNPLQYACWGNPMDRGAWWAMVQGISKQLDMTEYKGMHGEGILVFWSLYLINY